MRYFLYLFLGVLVVACRKTEVVEVPVEVPVVVPIVEDTIWEKVATYDFDRQFLLSFYKHSRLEELRSIGINSLSIQEALGARHYSIITGQNGVRYWPVLNDSIFLVHLNDSTLEFRSSAPSRLNLHAVQIRLSDIQPELEFISASRHVGILSEGARDGNTYALVGFGTKNRYGVLRLRLETRDVAGQMHLELGQVLLYNLRFANAQTFFKSFETGIFANNTFLFSTSELSYRIMLDGRMEPIMDFQNRPANAFFQVGTDSLFAAQGQKLYLSTDAGQQWREVQRDFPFLFFGASEVAGRTIFYKDNTLYRVGWFPFEVDTLDNAGISTHRIVGVESLGDSVYVATYGGGLYKKALSAIW